MYGSRCANRDCPSPAHLMFLECPNFSGPHIQTTRQYTQYSQLLLPGVRDEDYAPGSNSPLRSHPP